MLPAHQGYLLRCFGYFHFELVTSAERATHPVVPAPNCCSNVGQDLPPRPLLLSYQSAAKAPSAAAQLASIQATQAQAAGPYLVWECRRSFSLPAAAASSLH